MLWISLLSTLIVRVQHVKAALLVPFYTTWSQKRLLLLMVSRRTSLLFIPKPANVSACSYIKLSLLAPAITQHNVVFQAAVMGKARDAIMSGTFPEFLRSFFATYFGGESGPGYPRWCIDALRSVGVDILEGIQNPKIIEGDGAKWEYAD